MSTEKTKKFYATRNFKDAGTGAAYEAGKQYEVPEGVHGNYEACGLASDKKPDAAPAGENAPA